MGQPENHEVIISDACCLIDLREADLLFAFFSLPYRFWMPDLVFAELISFSSTEQVQLQQHGLEIRSLSGKALQAVLTLQAQKPRLSWQDCSAFVLADQTPDSILLTSDHHLRLHAQSQGQRVHGLLWVIDQLDLYQRLTHKALCQVLRDWKASAFVFLPAQELQQRIQIFCTPKDRQQGPKQRPTTD